MALLASSKILRRVCSIKPTSIKLVPQPNTAALRYRVTAAVAEAPPEFNDSKEIEDTLAQTQTVVSPPMDFSNHYLAFKAKSTYEILRALAVYRICSYEILIRHTNNLISLSRKLFGKRGFELLMKSTFYGHFVAGETQEVIKGKLDLMQKYGVGAILDYAVEADMPADEREYETVPDAIPEKYEVTDLSDIHNQYRAYRTFPRNDNVYSARTYYYEGEEKCDDNMDVFLKCIDTTGNTATNGFAAIKITALGRPAILLRLSQILNQTQYYFDQLAAKSGALKNEGIALEAFKTGIRDLGVEMTEDDIEKIFEIIDVNEDKTIDAVEWHSFLTPQLKLHKLFRAKPKKMGELGEPIMASMTDRELKEMENMQWRLLTICNHAKEKGVRLMVDAEQTYFQPAISRMTLEAMRSCNQESPVVFNTYQCYLKDSPTQIERDIELSRREGFYFACKLVRGAYMDQERLRATTLGYEDPIHENIDNTNHCYNSNMSMVLNEVQRNGANIMVASHNEDSVKYAVKSMSQLGLAADANKVFFGQLLGMCDAITYALGQAGYAAYKYVPYGPVDEVIPYLSRRGAENRSLMKGVMKERDMLWSELKRRARQGQLGYNPAAAAVAANS